MEQSNTSVGYLTVRVSTARGAIPLENASVTIRGSTQESSSVIYSLLTDSDGKTPKVTLPTPDISESSTPESKKPYATYSIDVFKDGYIPVSFNEVPIFPSILSIQSAILVPFPEPDPKAPYPPALNNRGVTLNEKNGEVDI